MKFDIIIKDATIEEAQRIIALASAKPVKSIDGHLEQKNIKEFLNETKLEVLETPTSGATTSESKNPPFAGTVLEGFNPAQNPNVPAAILPQSTLTIEPAKIEIIASGTNHDFTKLDKEGLPWDGRIHAGTKTQTAKNVWKRKKGISSDLVTQVEAELRSLVTNKVNPDPLQQPAPTLSPEAMFQQPAPVPQAVNTFHQQPTNTPVVQQPVQQAFHTAAVATDTPIDFGTFMTKLSTLFNQGIVTQEQSQQLAEQVGKAFNTTLTSITGVANNPAMLQYAVQCLKDQGKWL